MNHRLHRSNVVGLFLGLAGSACIANLAAAGMAWADAQVSSRDAIVATASPTVRAPQPVSADVRTPLSAVEAAPRLHANAEHPAVLQWRRARAGQMSLNTDHFLVQPPASAQWALQSAP